VGSEIKNGVRVKNGEYVLKHNDYDVALIQFNDIGNISKINEILLKERLPLGCVIEGIVSGKKIQEWWNDRGIPVNRENYNFLLTELKNGGKNNWLKESLGLSLSDHYWITDSDKKWKDVNYYDNSFNDKIGELIIGKIGRKEYEKIHKSNTPCFSSGGNLIKRWLISDNGERILEKYSSKPYRQEGANEEIASLFCEKLLIPHVKYKKSIKDKIPISICSNMTDQKREYCSANDVFYIKAQNIFKDSKYDHYCKCSKDLGIDNITDMLDKMLVLDYLIFNHDRHYHNFGVLRNSDTISEYAACPLFDNGASLFYKDIASNINLIEKEKLGKVQTFDTLEKQLYLVKEWNWVNIKNIKGMGKTCKDILMEVPDFELTRAEKIGEVVDKRIDQLEMFINNINREK
jgi:hypothetical protein